MRTSSDLGRLSPDVHPSRLMADAPEIAPPQCRYCGCDHEHPCALDKNFAAVDVHRAFTKRHLTQACSWHRLVELVGDDGHTTVDYFAVCTNATCVRAYLADRSAP